MEITLGDLEAAMVRSSAPLLEALQASRTAAPAAVTVAQADPRATPPATQSGTPAPAPTPGAAVPGPDAPIMPDGAQIALSNTAIGRGLDQDVRIPFLKVSLPVWGAIAGTAGGIIVGDVIDNVFAPRNDDESINLLNPALQLVAAGSIARYGPDWIGKDASLFGAGSLIVRLAFRYTPIPEWMAKLEERLSKPIGSVVDPQNRAMDYQQPSVAFANHEQAPPMPVPIMRPARSLAFA